MRVSKWAKLRKTQAELDFVDIDTSFDTPLFVDPYAISIKKDRWSRECATHIQSFFSSLISALKRKDDARVTHLVSHFHEPQETFLGLSKNEPQGAGIGPGQARQLVAALRRSAAVKTGLLSELAETELFIDGIGPDKVSDLTTNIIRGPLIGYTQEQAALWSMKLTAGLSVGPFWSPEHEDWLQDYQSLPVIDGKPVILVPKYSVRQRISLNSQEFYNGQMTDFLRAEYLEAGGSLVRVLKRTKQRVVRKKDVRAAHPFSKSAIGDFVRAHPHILELYKSLKGAVGAPSSEEIDKHFDPEEFSDHLIAQVRKIKPGRPDADKYHNLCIGALTYIFHPRLIKPIKEREINEGRKRIDLAFTNAAEAGFFNTMLQGSNTRAIEVVFECKNYSADPANPEVDQICGRFSHTRGFLGFICCRSFENKALFLKRCKDAARDRGQYVLVIDDEILIKLLLSAGKRLYSQIEDELRAMFAELIS